LQAHRPAIQKSRCPILVVWSLIISVSVRQSACYSLHQCTCLCTVAISFYICLYYVFACVDQFISCQRRYRVRVVPTAEDSTTTSRGCARCEYRTAAVNHCLIYIRSTTGIKQMADNAEPTEDSALVRSS